MARKPKMPGTTQTRTDSQDTTGKGITSRAIDRLVNMDRTEELCLLTAAFCALGSAVAAQARHS